MSVRYEKDVRYVNRNRELIPENIGGQSSVLIKHGVYLITGGAGGLGLIFAEYLAREYQARLVLSGRSELSEDKKLKILELEALGSEVIYVKGDISVRKDVETLLNEAKARFGEINGIIHNAGINRDSYIIRKTMEEVETVLRPKINGVALLDEMTKDEQLDFFAVFSSIAAVTGNAGQIDYAYANGYLDAYVGTREELRKKGERKGKSLTINWPLWKDGGMHVDAEVEKYIFQAYGLKPLTTKNGLKIFSISLEVDRNQLFAGEGNIEKMKTALGISKDQSITTEVLEKNQVSQDFILDKLKQDMSQSIARILKIEPSEIDMSKDIAVYGFDSVTFSELANVMSKTYKTTIIPSIFYEHTTLNSLLNFLVSEYSHALSSYYNAGSKKDEAYQGEKSKGYEPIQAELKQKHPARVKKSLIREQERISDPVAIVGIGGVMPMSEDLEEFWKNLLNGVDMISEIPPDRWDWKEYYGDPTKDENKTNIKFGGFMKEVDKFDAAFFGISPVEAELMDPQQRIMLQVVWKVIEDAGYRASDLSGSKTGVFIGCWNSGYFELQTRAGVTLHSFNASSSALSVVSNRISYLFNFHGPSESVDTACSSSLIAIHRAMESIGNGDCDMAIAGGVNVLINPDVYIATSKAGMLSIDGRCKTFDKKANGYVRSEGAGAVFLKPLSKAVRDRDHIYAVIKGSAVNHGGKVNSLTTPNPNAQAELIKTAWKRSGLAPDTVSYMEAHGTGTNLGDPIEISGLKKAFNELYRELGKPYPSEMKCGIGAVKSNAGHLETAAGVAGLFKVLLSMKYKKIPGNLHIHEQNPYIQLEDSPFYIIDKTVDWESKAGQDGEILPRRAGISSFGFGGANAHLVLEEYVAGEDFVSRKGMEKPLYLFVLSAKNKDRLKAISEKMFMFIEKMESKEHDMAEAIEYTLQTGREAMEERLAIVADSLAVFRKGLADYVNERSEGYSFFTGNIKNIQKSGQLLVKHSKEELERLAMEGNLELLAKAWIQGNDVDFKLLYKNSMRPVKLPLPTYQFTKKRYWIANSNVGKAFTGHTAMDKLHPLVWKNISTLKEQKFLTVITGKESFVSDHVVMNNPMLPGAAFLEMARAAGEIASEEKIAQMKEIVWMKQSPVFNEELELHTVLTQSKNSIQFEIFKAASQKKETLVKGGMVTESSCTLDNPKKLNIPEIKSRSMKTIPGSEIYPLFKEIGLQYGDSFRVIQELHIHNGGCLSIIELNEKAQADLKDWVLAPALMDGVLQSVIGVFIRDNGEKKLTLPYSIGEFSIFDKLQNRCYVYVSEIKETQNQKGEWKFNIEVADMQGRILARIKEFLLKEVMNYSAKTAHSNAAPKGENLMEILKGLQNGKIRAEDALSRYKSIAHKK
mgnify:CR=1 FL=1